MKRPERVHEALARQLRAAILRGEYRPGERLPIERELSERFEVSRSVVRQAMLLLDQQGLVRVRSGVGGGPFVTCNTLPAAIAAFENLLAVDPASIADFARAKLVLEPTINAMAAESISEDRIAALEANIAASRQALERGEEASDLMIEFHSIIVKSVDNQFLTLIGELMGRAVHRVPGVPEHVDHRRVLAEHEQMVDALRLHDAERVRELAGDHLKAIWAKQIDAG